MKWIFTFSTIGNSTRYKGEEAIYYLDQSSGLPWSKTTNELRNAGCERRGNAPVYVHANLVGFVDELSDQSLQQVILVYLILRVKHIQLAPATP